MRIATAALTVTMFFGAAAGAAQPRTYLGRTYDCRFTKAGHVVIDTREPGSSITVNGRRYAVTGGSYFYATDDGDVEAMFSPDMKRWGFASTDESTTNCVSHKNRR